MLSIPVTVYLIEAVNNLVKNDYMNFNKEKNVLPRCSAVLPNEHSLESSLDFRMKYFIFLSQF